MRDRGLKATTVNNRLRAINAYLHWYSPTGEKKCGAGCQHIHAPKLKEEKLDLPIFDTESVSRLLKWKPRTFHQHRLQTMIAFFCDIGAQAKEVLGVTWPDCDFDNLLVTLHGKGRKERKVPMSLELRRRLVLWQKRQAAFVKVNPAKLVFGTTTGVIQGRRDVLRDVKNVCRSLGFEPPRRTLHAFRHTFATEYLRKGGDVIRLQKVLGHTSLTMVMNDAHLQTSDLSAVHEKLSMLNQ